MKADADFLTSESITGIDDSYIIIKLIDSDINDRSSLLKSNHIKILNDNHIALSKLIGFEEIYKNTTKMVFKSSEEVNHVYSFKGGHPLLFIGKDINLNELNNPLNYISLDGNSRQSYKELKNTIQTHKKEKQKLIELCASSTKESLQSLEAYVSKYYTKNTEGLQDDEDECDDEIILDLNNARFMDTLSSQNITNHIEYHIGQKLIISQFLTYKIGECKYEDLAATINPTYEFEGSVPLLFIGDKFNINLQALNNPANYIPIRLKEYSYLEISKFGKEARAALKSIKTKMEELSSKIFKIDARKKNFHSEIEKMKDLFSIIQKTEEKYGVNLTQEYKKLASMHDFGFIKGLLKNNSLTLSDVVTFAKINKDHDLLKLLEDSYNPTKIEKNLFNDIDPKLNTSHIVYIKVKDKLAKVIEKFENSVNKKEDQVISQHVINESSNYIKDSKQEIISNEAVIRNDVMNGKKASSISDSINNNTYDIALESVKVKSLQESVKNMCLENDSLLMDPRNYCFDEDDIIDYDRAVEYKSLGQNGMDDKSF